MRSPILFPLRTFWGHNVPQICQRFCGPLAKGTLIPTALRAQPTDGTLLCMMFCEGFAKGRPVTLNRPAASGRKIALKRARRK